MDENEELENQNQEQNKNRFDGSSISNPATNIATKAQNVQKVANQMSKTLAKNEKRKSQAQILAKVAKNAGKVSNVAAKLAPVITVAAIIILIIIFLIGIVTFIITGFGYIMAGLQKTVGGILDCISGTFSGDENNVHKETIVDTLTYIKELGYDLYGYGFVTKEDALKEETTEEEVTDDQGNKSTVSTSNYSLNYKTDDEAYRYVNSYIVSDNYANLIKNSNRNFQQAFSSFSNFFSGLAFDSSKWGTGLISIYHQNPKQGGSITGKKGDNYIGFENGSITVNNGKLAIKTGGLLDRTTLEYNLDGWTGRYSMPLEFLLSVHIATMSPDLSYKLATSFNTDVEILLYGSTNGAIDAAVQEEGKESTRTLRTELAKLNNSVWTNVWDVADNISLSKEEVREVFEKTKLKSYEGENEIYKCKGPPFYDEKETTEFGWPETSLTDSSGSYTNVGAAVSSVVPEDEAIRQAIFPDIMAKLSAFSEKSSLVEIESQAIVEDKSYTLVIRGTSTTGSNGTTNDVTTVIFKEQAEHTAGLVCSDSANTTGTVCDECFDYVKLIYEALNQIQKSDLETWVPYINKVSKHWFRDVYFTRGALEDAKVDSVIQNDDEYEKKTGERWTLYETYTDEAGNTDYELYVYLNDNGNYYEKMQDNLVCKKVDKGKGNYKLADDGITYEKADNGDYKLQIKNGENDYSDYNETPDEFRVGKKALLQSKNDLWEKTNGVGAYEVGSSSATWQKLESTNSEKIDTLKTLGMEVLYKLDIPVVKQVEDGVRGETNSIIKKLFLDNYYVYDGTAGTAALIQKAKKMVSDADSKKDADDPDSFRELVKSGKLQDKIATNYTDSQGNVQKYTATIDQISSAISLSHSSLSAFSMLENMHTLDAEYIYHDFKELIVELNYFDKEDLTEPAASVMMFPVSGVSSAGWPVVRYDKSEDFYGTLIHSAEDLEANRAETEIEIAKIADPEEEEEETSSATLNSISVTESGTIDWNSVDGLTDAQKCVLQAAEDIQYTGVQKGWHYYSKGYSLKSSFEDSKKGVCCATLVCYVAQACGVEFTASHGSNSVNDNLIAAGAKEIKTSSMSELQPGDFIVKGVDGSGHTQIFAGKDDNGNYMWYNWGSDKRITTDDQPYVSNNVSFERIVRITDLELSYNGVSSSGSSSEFAGYQGEEPIVAPVSGQVIKYGTVNRKNIITGEDNEVGFIKIKVLDQGTPGKGCNYFVGTHDSVTAGNGKKYAKGELSASEWLEDNYSENELKKLGYDYFWEEYNEAGICGHVLYIEGIDVSEILGENVEQGENAGGNISKLAEYIAKEDTSNSYSTAYRVPNLLDDKREFELKVAEEAKKQADYVLTKGNKVFIKEGAVIGKTYTSDNENITKKTKVEVLAGNKEENTTENNSSNNESSTGDVSEIETEEKKFNLGNYMRIIFRDNDDEVVENVEDYIENDKNGNASGIYGDLEAIDEDSTDAEKVRAIVSYFKDNGFTTEAACGIVGNLIQESNLDPTSVSDSGYHGLAMWNTNDGGGHWWDASDGIREWMLSLGYNETSFAGQVRAIYEATRRGQMSEDLWNELKELTNLDQATELFCVYYEACPGGSDPTVYYKVGSNYQELNKRKIFAKNAYDIYLGDDSKGLKDGG